MCIDTILHGDALAVLRSLPDESVHCIVTSPPYWGLRDYGAPGQLGLEPTPDEYVGRMVEVFRDARRVLRSDGSLWLNLGDSYAGGGRGGQSAEKRSANWQPTYANHGLTPPGLKPKDLVGIPWRVAFALQADGWWLRSDIIWHKPNCMPESVRDRPTKAHEYVFLLTKSERYYYDASAILEQSKETWRATDMAQKQGTKMQQFYESGGSRIIGAPTRHSDAVRNTRNKRDVWTISTRPYAGAHFAVMPPALVEPCVLAGCPGRCCETCGAPWVRVVGREKHPTRDVEAERHLAAVKTGRRDGAIPGPSNRVDVTFTIGYRPTCRCAVNTGAARGVVLDPFMGAGTVGVVARRHSRHYLGIELNAEYITLAETRIGAEVQPVLWSIAGEVA